MRGKLDFDCGCQSLLRDDEAGISHCRLPEIAEGLDQQRRQRLIPRPRMNTIRTFNVEAGLPFLDEARRLVIGEVKRAKRDGVKVLKVIHGYGSSGTGGRLCVGLRKSFRLRKKEGAIKDFIAGEDFSIFNNTVLALLEAVPELRGDPDLSATNEGVTILWLK
jgi:hypothetical protein